MPYDSPTEHPIRSNQEFIEAEKRNMMGLLLELDSLYDHKEEV